MNFESEYTRWLDGAMNESEAAEFVVCHGLDPRALTEWLQIRSQVVQSAQVAIPEHPDFLDTYILQGIASVAAAQPRNVALETLLQLPRLAWMGGGMLILAIFLSFLVPGPFGNQAASEIISSRSGDSNVSVHFLKTSGSRSAAVSLDGVGVIPADTNLK